MDNTLSLDYQQTDFGREFAEEVERLDGRIDGEVEARSEADNNLQNQIDTIKASSDVVDIVGTKAELDGYDTSKLSDNDIVKVLEDETHDGDITYYRWSTSTEAFSFIGSLSAYYSKGETDNLLSGKQDTLTAGTNIQISNNVISATDTTYTAGAGIDITNGVISSTAATATTVYGDQVEHDGFVYLQFYLDNAKTDLITIDEMVDLLEAGSVIINTPLADSTTKNFYVVAYQAEETASGTVLYFYTTEGGGISRYYTWSDADQFDGAKQHLYWLQNKLSAGSNISIQGDTISATDTTYSNFVGTDGTAAGTAGLVPAPAAGDEVKYLAGDGTWKTISTSSVTTFYANGNSTMSKLFSDSAMTTAVKGEDVESAYNNGKVVICIIGRYDRKNIEVVEMRTIPSMANYIGFILAPTEDDTITQFNYPNKTTTSCSASSITLQQKIYAGSNLSWSGNTLNAIDTTYSAFTGATSSAAGSAGLVPAPTTSDPDKYLKGDGTWANLPSANNISSTDWSALWQ